MLLDLDITIKVTNNGKDNTVEVKTKPTNKFIHVATAIELASQAQKQLITQYVADKGKVLAEKEADVFIRTATMQDLIQD